MYLNMLFTFSRFLTYLLQKLNHHDIGMKLNQLDYHLVIIKTRRFNNLPLFDDGKHLFEFSLNYQARNELFEEISNKII